MTEISVTCGCGRSMTERGIEPAGTWTCGCGSRVTVQVQRKASCSWLAQSGEPCRVVPMSESATLGVLLCGDHLRALGELFEARVTEVEDRLSTHFANVSTEWATSVGEARGAVRIQRERRNANATWWVYYISIGDLIKIGTTGDFKGRMGTLMPDEVLAVEPGSYDVERERKRQFVHLRVRGERFSPGPDLLTHIEQVRKLRGDPLVITRQPSA